MKRIIQEITKKNELLLLPVLGILFILFSQLTPFFLTVDNLMQMLLQLSDLGFITIGYAFILIAGCSDLSIGTMASMICVFIAMLIGGNADALSTPLGLLISLAIALSAGCLNGVLVGVLKVTPMLATIGTQSLYKGIAMATTNAATISCRASDFIFLGSHRFFGYIPIQFVLVVIVGALATVVLNKTSFGRKLYLIGENEDAAKYSGINTKLIIVAVYICASFMVWCCSVITVARATSAHAEIADNFTLLGISAAVFGGIRMGGGKGNIIGAFIGAAIFTVIANGLSMMNASSFLQQIINGALLIGVLTIKHLSNRHSEAR